LNKIQPKTLFLGKITKYLSTCHSTNDIASEMIQKTQFSQEEVIEGTVIVTDNQTAGRGQRGNSWEAQAGENLTFSLILKPSFLQASEQFQLNVAVSLGVYDFLSKYLDEGLKVKWSNDLYYENQKLGGILIENTLSGYQIGYSVVGIGLNINQKNFGISTATSLFNLSCPPQPYQLEELLENLLEAIEKNYLALKNGNYQQLKAKYLSVLFRFQEWHWFKQNEKEFMGQIIGIDETGKLALEVNDKINYYDFKEIQFVI
jgi:BirA family transcriptional regulator, biotin operon repressor / biotin---[acetyl-CoA-carboxylase] ligase